MLDTGLFRLLGSVLGEAGARSAFEQLHVAPALLEPVGPFVTRAELAQALNMALFVGVMQRVPEGAAYVADCERVGNRVVFDHGALRTVAWPSGALPPGEAAITRVLRPLGFVHAETYPLPKLKMTGRSWRHQDFPEDIAQFFVSELHPEQFSGEFQAAVSRVVGASRDPLSVADTAALERLSRDGRLPLAEALALLPHLLGCFERQHPLFALDDYELLKRESAEMAWIATEGNAFNHATDRVTDIETLAELQRTLGRPIKERVEVSRSGRVRQTAFRAAQVQRQFLHEGHVISQSVPGSFHEFIQRERDGAGLDLRFDAGNATGIFKMTDTAMIEAAEAA